MSFLSRLLAAGFSHHGYFAGGTATSSCCWIYATLILICHVLVHAVSIKKKAQIPLDKAFIIL